MGHRMTRAAVIATVPPEASPNLRRATRALASLIILKLPMHRPVMAVHCLRTTRLVVEGSLFVPMGQGAGLIARSACLVARQVPKVVWVGQLAARADTSAPPFKTPAAMHVPTRAAVIR